MADPSTADCATPHPDLVRAFPGPGTRPLDRVSLGALPPELHPLLQALMDDLPPAGAQWSREQAMLWLRAAVAIFDLVYGKNGEITIA